MQARAHNATPTSVSRLKGYRTKILTLAIGAALGVTAVTAPQVFSHTDLTVNAETFRSAASAPGFATIAQHVRPSVVHIAVKARVTPAGGGLQAPNEIPPQMREFMERFGLERFGHGIPGMPPATPNNPMGPVPTQGIGSGFIISESGYIVTNQHVVGGADEVTVTLDDGSELDARVVGTDPKTDLALLKVEAQRDLPYVTFGDSDEARVGDWVVAVGSPFGLGGTFSAGIVSARGRDIHSGPYDDFIQTDASINRGNSGGPLFNTAGEVIGVNTAIFSPSGGNVGIGFAVPASLAAPVIEQLKTHGHVDRGRLGVNLQDLSEDLAQGLGIPVTEGALIASVEPGSMAEKAGLRAGDVITAIDNEPMSDAKTVARRVGSHRHQDSLTLSLLRDGKPTTVDVTLGKQPGEMTEARAKDGDEGSKHARVGARIAELTPEARAQWNIDDGIEGALIVGLEPGGPAAAKQLRPGDVIVQVDRSPVKTTDEVVDAIRKSGTDDGRVVLRIHREGQSRFVALDLTHG